MEGAMASSSDRNVQILLSAAEMIKFRDTRKVLQFTLRNGQILEGAVRWYDAEAFHIVTDDRTELTIFKNAVLFYGPKEP